MQLKNFIHVRSRGFVFGYVPKVACTNWKSVFRQLEGQPDPLNPRLAHDRQAGGLTYLDTLDPAAAQALLDDPSVPKYTFVRNPYSRALSAYLNKVERFNHPEGQPGEAHFRQVHAGIRQWHARRGRSLDSVAFDDFLAFVEGAKQHPWAKDEHWLPQHLLVAPDRVRYDFIGRFENLQADAAELLRRMACDAPFPSREAIRFPGSGTEHKVAQHYTPEAAAAVRRIYAHDFELLGYDPADAPA